MSALQGRIYGQSIWKQIDCGIDGRKGGIEKMCGIAGVSCRSAESSNFRLAVERMIAAMTHRGPDDHGTEFISTQGCGLVLGNTRLAILDLSSAGHQPMLDPETGNACVLNGEIYNHLEIRRELPNVRWRSTSDTETVLQAYAAWGVKCVQRFRGMFAIAIHDAQRQLLWCARDRLGIKPFYYGNFKGCFVFASEVNALLQSGLPSHELDRDGVASYMQFGSVIEPFTLVRGIRSLPAGHWVEVRDGFVGQVTKYWSWSDPASNGFGTEATALELLRTSVQEHMISDVPVACFLSGGIDSSAVTACAANVCSTPIHTFTVAFRGTKMDESAHAQSIANRFSTEHTEVRLPDSEVARQVPLSVAAMDLPSIDGTNTFIVSHAVRASGVKVVLSGLGGDELFGGYRSFRLLPWAARWSRTLGRLPEAILRTLPGGERAVELLKPGLSLGERYIALRSFWPTSELQRMEVPSLPGLVDEPDPSLPINTRISMLELSFYMRSVLLRDSDVMSMANSIELRVPFLDHRLVSFALKNHLAGNGKKQVLLDSLQDVLPAHTMFRKKQGFELPMSGWFHGVLQEFCDEGLDSLQKGAVLGIAASEFKQRFLIGELSWARLWQAVVLGHWLKRFNASALTGVAGSGDHLG